MLRSLRHALGKYTGSMRAWKPLHVVYNLLNRDKLAHNRTLYKEHGLNKAIVSPVSRADFDDTPADARPWIDQPDALAKVKAHPSYATFTPELQASIDQFVEEGFLIIKGLYSRDDVDQFNAEVDRLLQGGEVDYNFTGRKLMNAHRASSFIDERFYRNPEVLRLLSFLLGREVRPFQSITFTEGSEQAAHSDSIHMMTQPEGYLIATWTAFEPTSDANGALFYYPGSHKLPIVSTRDFDAGHTKLRIGHDANKKYEDAIAELIEQQGLERRSFYAEAGDMLVWHANLLHGGGVITEPGTSRRSMVGHYFGKDVICYHELTHRPALMED